MTELHPHLQALHRALADEQAAERDELARLRSLSLADQVHAGLAWPPLEVLDATAGPRRRLLLRARGVALHDGIGPGDPVSIGQPHADGVPGLCLSVEDDAVELAVDAEPLPTPGERVVVRRRADPSSWVRQRKALEQAQGGRSPLRAVLLGDRPPSPGLTLRAPPALDDLDEAQRRAALQALGAGELGLIWGPPGTGKTRVLAALLQALVEDGERPWALADSNAAVDHLAVTAAARGLDVVRIGHPSRLGAAAAALSLDARIARSPLGPALASLDKEIGRAWGTRTVGPLLAERDRLRDQARAHALGSAQVIASTFGTLLLRSQDLPPAKTAVVDEATQATEAAIWAVVPHVQRLILAGDPRQLGPVTRVPGSLLERSLLERLAETTTLPMLEVQHRMSAPIRALVREVYGPTYTDAPSVAGAALPGAPAVLWVDTAGTGAEEERDPATLSTFSRVEVALVAGAVARLRADGVAPEAIGVVTPYSAQVARLRARPELAGVEVATVNAFQGREKDVIVVSFVRSNDAGELGFVADPRRLTVTLTRARRALWLIGDTGTLGGHPRFEALLAELASRGALVSAWEEPWSEALG